MYSRRVKHAFLPIRQCRRSVVREPAAPAGEGDRHCFAGLVHRSAEIGARRDVDEEWAADARHLAADRAVRAAVMRPIHRSASGFGNWDAFKAKAGGKSMCCLQ